MTSYLLSRTPIIFWKWRYSKREQYASKGRKLIPFRMESFSEGRQNNFGRVVCPENVSISVRSWTLRVRLLQICYSNANIFILPSEKGQRQWWDVGFWQKDHGDLKTLIIVLASSIKDCFNCVKIRSFSVLNIDHLIIIVHKEMALYI